MFFLSAQINQILNMHDQIIHAKLCKFACNFNIFEINFIFDNLNLIKKDPGIKDLEMKICKNLFKILSEITKNLFFIKPKDG
jgi:hypothetical protein